jgi:hypothetical protein
VINNKDTFRSFVKKRKERMALTLDEDFEGNFVDTSFVIVK